MNRIINRLIEILPDILIYLLLFLVICLIIIYSQDNAFLYDDFIECSYGLNEGIFDSLLPGVTIHGGGYTSIFLTKFTTLGIPYLFNIHPGDYLCEIAPIIKGILYAVFFFVSIKCVLMRNHSKWLFLSSVMFLSFYLLFFLTLSNLMCIKDNETFFRYVFCSMFYFILFTYTYKNIIYRNLKTKGGGEFCIVVLSVITAASNLETIIFAFCLFFFLIVCYNILIDFISYLKKSKIFKRIYKYNLNIKFYAPVLLFYIISFIYLKSPRYYDNFNGRGFGSFVFSIENVSEFLNLFWQLYILPDIIYWIILILLIIAFLYRQKNVLQKKKLICALFMIFSIIAVYFSLIVCGKNGYDGDYWISDIKLLIFFNVMALAPAFILLDDILKHVNVKYKKLCITGVCLFLCVSSLYYAILMYNNRNRVSDVYIFRKINYINEKMYRYFFLRNETPYLVKINPNPRDKDWVPFLFLELLNGNNDYFDKPEICSNEETRTSVYIQKVYGVKLPDGVKFCLSDDALDKFFKSGGVISKNELNNIKFSKLKDADFVLNNNLLPDDKMSEDEIIDIYRSFYN